MLRSIKTFIKDPEPTNRFDEVEPGVNIVEGIVRVEEPLRSPVRQQTCAAFFYRSFLVMTEGRAPAIHKIKECEGYATFNLEMDGGVIEVVPPKPTKFDHTGHMELGRQYGKNFQGVEDVVMPGAKVRVHGKVKKIDGKFVMKIKEVSVLEKQAVAAGMGGDRKKRKKQKK